MTIIAINPNKTINYSLITDTDEDKVIFHLGVIDSLVRSYIDDTHLEVRRAYEDKQDVKFEDVALHDKYLNFVRFGLKGWDNFKDASGAIVPFKTVETTFPRLGKRTVVSDESLIMLELTYLIELGIRIVNINTVKAEDVKN